MPNLESLMEKIAEVIIEKREGEVWFTSLDDMLYAYLPNNPTPRSSKTLQLKSSEDKQQAPTHSDRILHKTKTLFHL